MKTDENLLNAIRAFRKCSTFSSVRAYIFKQKQAKKKWKKKLKNEDGNWFIACWEQWVCTGHIKKVSNENSYKISRDTMYLQCNKKYGRKGFKAQI